MRWSSHAGGCPLAFVLDVCTPGDRGSGRAAHQGGAGRGRGDGDVESAAVSGFL